MADDRDSQILDQLDVLAEYQSLGLKFASDSPRASGWIECYAIGRDDRKPSAAVNINTGRYLDKGGKGLNLSLWDFAVKFGDFSDWRVARKHYAKQTGVALTGGKKKEEDWKTKLHFLDWNEGHERLATLWCHKAKPGATVEAIRAAGGRVARYPCYVDKKTKEFKEGEYKVIALPAYGPAGVSGEPVAWVLWDIIGKKLKVYRGKGREPDYVKMKSIGPTYGTLMNQAGMLQLESDPDSVEVIWKTGGPSDMLALMAIIPESEREKHLVLTNASGENGDVLGHQVELLAGKKVFVVHDTDDAGELGATKWLTALRKSAAEVRHIRLPYDITPKAGKDLRDWLAEQKASLPSQSIYETLLNHAKVSGNYRSYLADGSQQGDLWGEASPDEPFSKVDKDQQADTLIEKKIVDTLQIDVLGKTDRSGIKIFSTFHRRSEVIQDISRLSYEQLVLMAGPPIKAHVLRSKSDDVPDMFSVSDVRDAFALLAGYRPIGEQTELGVGCWQGMQETGEEYPSVVIVGANEAAEWNGSNKLRNITHPRCRGHLLDFDSGAEPWYDFDSLSKLLDHCDKDFTERTKNDAINLFSRWRWDNPAISPIVLTGLVFASWVQSLWNWRPQVALVGPSKAGKTFLCTALTGIFGKLCEKSSQSTAAGIRQIIKSSAKIILCDEFEQSKYREEVLEMLRVSGRGDAIWRGTANQKGQRFSLRHIVWVAAIEVGLKREADRNRFITLELQRPPKELQGKLTLPPPSELAELGQRMLAVAIRSVQRARILAMKLKDTRIEGVDDRVIESFAVPAAMLAAIDGMTDKEAAELLEEMLTGMKLNIVGESRDEDSLLEAIFNSHILTGRETSTVAQLIDTVINQKAGNVDAEHGLAKSGIKIDLYGDGDETPPDLAGEQCLVIAYKAVSEHLLKPTDWRGQSIDQILKRIKHAILTRRRVGGQRSQAVLLPLSYLKEKFLGNDSQKTIF